MVTSLLSEDHQRAVIAQVFAKHHKGGFDAYRNWLRTVIGL